VLGCHDVEGSVNKRADFPRRKGAAMQVEVTHPFCLQERQGLVQNGRIGHVQFLVKDHRPERQMLRPEHISIRR
jgi:hypothetical protein